MSLTGRIPTPPLTPWERAKRWISPTEGKGYAMVDQPTSGGVIQSTLDEAIRLGIVPRGTTLRNLTAAQVEDIFRVMFWDACSCSHLPPALALCVFDGAINSGPGQSTKWLQRALNEQGETLAVDGGVGPYTIAAAYARPLGPVLASALDQRRAFDRKEAKKPEKARFLGGWLARITRLEALCRELLPAPEGETR